MTSHRSLAVRLVLDPKHAPVKWTEAKPLIHSTDSGVTCYLDDDAAAHIARLTDLPRQRLSDGPRDRTLVSNAKYHSNFVFEHIGTKSSREADAVTDQVQAVSRGFDTDADVAVRAHHQP